MKIVVAGGGYAGLACLMELRSRMPDAQLHLYDPRGAHLKLTHLHETVRRSVQRFEVSFAELGRRLRFEHHRRAIEFERGVAAIDGQTLDYDFLAVTTGAAALPLPVAPHVYDRDALREHGAREIVDEFIADTGRPRVVTVVGGGASGIQFLFELADRLRAGRCDARLRLVDLEARPLTGQPDALGDYVIGKMRRDSIEYLPQTRYIGATARGIEVAGGSATRALDSGLTLLLPGVRPAPLAFEADRYGRIAALDNAWGAGDCTDYDSRGDDALTAQVAVRQGKHIARNIDRASRGIEPLEYFFRELGYVVSLGAADAAGWMLVREHAVTGLAAFAIKGVVEAQYDLFVAGLDTYIV